MTEVHRVDVGEPYPHDDRFIVSMTMDSTPSTGPMAGKRHEEKEMCLYTVKDGKISRVEFFYKV
jgi:ketosteroid isomerase-like protein